MNFREHMKKLQVGLDTLDDTDDGESEDASRRKASGSLPATSNLYHYSEEVKELVAKKGHAIDVSLDMFDDSPHHVGPLDESRVAKLQANLEGNPQSMPVLARPSEAGRYEVLAGRHRIQALKNLGRTTALTVIREVTDEQSLRIVVYDNLLAPALTAYDRYMGLAAVRKARGLTIDRLCVESGISDAHKYFAFERLPVEAQEIVRSNRSRFGANQFSILAARASRDPQGVIDACKSIAAKTATRGDEIEKLNAKAASVPRRAPLAPRFTISVGDKQFAAIKTEKKTVRIDFDTDVDADRFTEEIYKFLEKRKPKG